MSEEKPTPEEIKKAMEKAKALQEEMEAKTKLQNLLKVAKAKVKLKDNYPDRDN